MSLFEPGKKSQVLPNAPAGLLYPGDPGVPAGLIPTDKKAFAPRLGIAWDPNGNGKLLVTAAYGIFYEPYYTGQGGPLQSPISAPPYPGNAAGEPAELRESVQRQSSGPRDVLHATHEPDSLADVDTPLHAGLGLEPAALVRVRLAVRDRIRRHQGHAPAALYRSEPGGIRSRNRGRPADFEFQQCRSTAALFRLHARRFAEQLPVFIDRRDRGHRQLVVQRVGSVDAQAVQPRAVIPRVVHVVEDDRRCVVVQHNRIGGEASRRRKRSRPGSVQSRSRAWALAVRRAQPIRWEL